MSKVRTWRRFRPKIKAENSGHQLYDLVRLEINQLLPRVKRLQWNEANWLNSAIDNLEKRNNKIPDGLRTVEVAASRIALVVMQTPRAARAQVMMDRHRGGYKEREKRLFELIDFNDAYVSAVLSLPEDQLSEFPMRLKSEMDLFARRLHVQAFTDDQYEAITHGLSREIAVYRGAVAEGLQVRMTSRVQDAMGIDMVITDPDSGKSINIDCKTRSSFFFRLVDLERQGRMSSNEKEYCEIAGYCIVNHGSIPVVLVRIATKYLGEIDNFSFVDTAPLGILLRSALNDHGQ